MSRGGLRRFDSPPHLPPPAAAPILEFYDLETKRIIPEKQLAAPVDDRNVVDIFKTVELALSLVDSDYIWPRNEPDPDVHHFVWERDKYHPRHFNGSLIPRDYRDKISFHKGYLPRQLHDFIHVVIAAPPIPDFAVMEARVRDYEVALSLFLSARDTITARRKPGSISGVPTCPDTGKILLDDEILSQIMTNFRGYFESTKERLEDGNEFIDDILLLEQPPEVVARQLGKIAAHNAINLMPYVYGNKKKAKMAA